MPAPARGVHDFYRADKAVFVGPAPTGVPDVTARQEHLARLNGALSSERQGDLHLLVVTDPAVSNPGEYTAAVQVHWQSPALGKNALSKNGVVLVVGSRDGRTISWARAFTGMPVGNEHLGIAVREDLPGTALTPQALLGTPRATITGDPAAPVRVAHSDGAMDRLLFAESGGYQRVQMADFDYLKTQVQPSTGQKATIVAVGLLAAVAVWVIFLVVGAGIHHPLRRTPTSSTSPLSFQRQAMLRARGRGAITGAGEGVQVRRTTGSARSVARSSNRAHRRR